VYDIIFNIFVFFYKIVSVLSQHEAAMDDNRDADEGSESIVDTVIIISSDDDDDDDIIIISDSEDDEPSAKYAGFVQVINLLTWDHEHLHETYPAYCPVVPNERVSVWQFLEQQIFNQ